MAHTRNDFVAEIVEPPHVEGLNVVVRVRVTSRVTGGSRTFAIPGNDLTLDGVRRFVGHAIDTHIAGEVAAEAARAALENVKIGAIDPIYED